MGAWIFGSYNQLTKEEVRNIVPFQTNCHRYQSELLQQCVEEYRALHATSTKQQHPPH